VWSKAHLRRLEKLGRHWPPNLKCKKCGSKDAIITTRDRTRLWARQRRGR
jgi:hypothetical protein